MVNERTVGWYSIAASLAATLIFIPNILTTAVFPALSRGATQVGDSASRILRKSLDVALITGVPIGFGLAIVANPLVELMYQSQFPQSGPVLSVMSITRRGSGIGLRDPVASRWISLDRAHTLCHTALGDM